MLIDPWLQNTSFVHTCKHRLTSFCHGGRQIIQNTTGCGPYLYSIRLVHIHTSTPVARHANIFSYFSITVTYSVQAESTREIDVPSVYTSPKKKLCETSSPPPILRRKAKKNNTITTTNVSRCPVLLFTLCHMRQSSNSTATV